MKLWKFVLRRLILLIPVLLGVSIIVFSLNGLQGERWTGYVDSERVTQEMIWSIQEQYHLNESEVVQYGYWLNGIIRGDWGYSKTQADYVINVIEKRFPATFELTFMSMIIAVALGVMLGTISAVNKNKPVDHVTRVMALVGVSIPVFWLGLILLNIFFFHLGVAPSGGRISLVYLISWGDNPILESATGFYLIDSLLMMNFAIFLDVLWHLLLPAITLSFGTIAILTRIMRSSMLEVMNQDYIKTARSKGLSERMVIKKHARRNAMIPTTTVSGLAFGGLLSGAVLTESIYSWPGLGRWATQAIVGNDPAAIMGFVLLVAILYTFVNLIVDVLYAYLDPRVQLE